MPEPHTGPGHSEAAVEVARRASGRFRFVIVREFDGAWWLHVQPAPAITQHVAPVSREPCLTGDGLHARQGVALFPGRVHVRGMLLARDSPDPRVRMDPDEAAAQVAAGLEPAIDALINVAAELEPLGIDLPLTD